MQYIGPSQISKISFQRKYTRKLRFMHLCWQKSLYKTYTKINTVWETSLNPPIDFKVNFLQNFQHKYLFNLSDLGKATGRFSVEELFCLNFSLFVVFLVIYDEKKNSKTFFYVLFWRNLFSVSGNFKCSSLVFKTWLYIFVYAILPISFALW